jgi:hypothetical protein
VSAIPRKHAHSLQRRPSLAFGCGTFADAKDQASLPLDGLLKDYPTPCFNELFGITERYALCFLGYAFEEKMSYG